MFQTISLKTEEARAIFYMHQTTGKCADVCTCDHMHQIAKTVKLTYLSLSSTSSSKILPESMSQGGAFKWGCHLIFSAAEHFEHIVSGEC